MINKKFIVIFFACVICFVNQSIAQITRQAKVESDGFKWVMVKDKTNDKLGAESPAGKQLIPLGSYIMIVYHPENEGFFEVFSLDKKAKGAWSLGGKEIIPLSRGYESIVKNKDNFGYEKNGIKGTCDFNGNEIVSSSKISNTQNTTTQQQPVANTAQTNSHQKKADQKSSMTHQGQRLSKVTRQAKTESDGFKWIMVTDKANAKLGVESPDGKQLIPLNSYERIVYHAAYGGYFEVISPDNETKGAWSLGGKEIIPLSRGYKSLVKNKDHFAFEKNGIKGTCDFNGNENSTFANGKSEITRESNQNTVSSQQITSNKPNANNSQKGAQDIVSTTSVTNVSGTAPGDKEQYRRSSLCLILLTHRDKKYAEAMERIFRSFPLPARYNEHNISGLRVISVSGSQSKSDIDRIVRSNEVAQKIVGRWFNRNSAGRMNMDLIHERGGYGASYADYQRARNNVRGTAMLQDEGIELLQSTFVLVCDMDYVDKKKGAGWAAFGTALLSAGAMTMSAINQQQANDAFLRGNYAEARNKMTAANAWGSGAALGAAATEVVADIGGFRVKMRAYLYKLQWDDNMTKRMYNEYWCDFQTPLSELDNRKKRFNNEASTFTLKYIGKYKTTSSKTILRSWKDEDQVILDVCERCVNKGMKKLAKSFPVFRPRAPFYFKEGIMYSHIGYKEEVSRGRKYEILQPYKDKKGEVCYKKVGVAKALIPWDNSGIRFDQYFDEKQLGTSFFCKNSSIDLHTPGLQLREL